MRSFESAGRSVALVRRDGVIGGRRCGSPQRRAASSRADHDRHRLGGDPDGHRATPGLFLADDPGGQAGQGRHVEQAEADAEAGQVVGPETAEQAARRDGAHLVVELRPADASTAVAEPHELDRVRIGWTWGRRCVGSIDGVPSSLNVPRAGRWRDVGGNTKLNPTGRSA